MDGQGKRPFTEEEIDDLLKRGFEGQRYAERNRCFLVMGICLGYRASELLSITVGHVRSPEGDVIRTMRIGKDQMKGKKKPRILTIPPLAQAAIARYLSNWEATYKGRIPCISDTFLFPSTKRDLDDENEKDYPKHPILLRQSLRIIKAAAKMVGMGRQEMRSIGTHSMRKVFASDCYEASGKDIIATQKMLGHSRVTTTQRYLPVSQEQMDSIIGKIDSMKPGRRDW